VSSPAIGRYKEALARDTPNDIGSTVGRGTTEGDYLIYMSPLIPSQREPTCSDPVWSLAKIGKVARGFETAPDWVCTANGVPQDQSHQ